MFASEEIDTLIHRMSLSELRDLTWELYTLGESVDDLIELIHRRVSEGNLRREVATL